MKTQYELQGRERLLQLVEHLERGKLGHALFDFNTYNSTLETRNGYCHLESTPHQCGTNGCALGECPIRFPDEWMFDALGLPRLMVLPDEDTTPWYLAMLFFGLSDEEEWALFQPMSPRPWRGESEEEDAVGLSDEATRFEVAANIREFLAWKDREIGHQPIQEEELAAQ